MRYGSKVRFGKTMYGSQREYLLFVFATISIIFRLSSNNFCYEKLFTENDFIQMLRSENIVFGRYFTVEYLFKR